MEIEQVEVSINKETEFADIFKRQTAEDLTARERQSYVFHRPHYVKTDGRVVPCPVPPSCATLTR